MASRTLQTTPGFAAPGGSPEYAQKRLSGSVWEHVPLALPVYRACLATGVVLGRAGVSANVLTYASLVLAGGAGLAAASGAFTTAAFLVLASGAFDVLDGVVARASGTSSRWGALLDSTVDRMADGLPLLGLTVFYAELGPLVAIPGLAILGAFTVSYVRARAEALGCILPPLFMRRAERVVLLAASLFAGAIPREDELVPGALALIGVAALGGASFAGVIFALRAARQVLLHPQTETRTRSD